MHQTTGSYAVAGAVAAGSALGDAALWTAAAATLSGTVAFVFWADGGPAPVVHRTGSALGVPAFRAPANG